MKVTITIDCDNEAFVNGMAPNEVSHILEKLSWAIIFKGVNGVIEDCSLVDVNGNRVGEMKVTP